MQAYGCNQVSLNSHAEMALLVELGLLVLCQDNIVKRQILNCCFNSGGTGGRHARVRLGRALFGQSQRLSAQPAPARPPVPQSIVLTQDIISLIAIAVTQDIFGSFDLTQDKMTCYFSLDTRQS